MPFSMHNIVNEVKKGTLIVYFSMHPMLPRNKLIWFIYRYLGTVKRNWMGLESWLNNLVFYRKFILWLPSEYLLISDCLVISCYT